MIHLYSQIFFENGRVKSFVPQNHRFSSTSRFGKCPDLLFQNHLKFLVAWSTRLTARTCLQTIHTAIMQHNTLSNYMNSASDDDLYIYIYMDIYIFLCVYIYIYIYVYIVIHARTCAFSHPASLPSPNYTSPHHTF